MSLIELQPASAGNLYIVQAQALAGPSVPGQLCELSYKKVIFSRFIDQFVFEILLTSDV